MIKKRKRKQNDQKLANATALSQGPRDNTWRSEGTIYTICLTLHPSMLLSLYAYYYFVLFLALFSFFKFIILVFAFSLFILVFFFISFFLLAMLFIFLFFCFFFVFGFSVFLFLYFSFFFLAMGLQIGSLVSPGPRQTLYAYIKHDRRLIINIFLMSESSMQCGSQASKQQQQQQP